MSKLNALVVIPSSFFAEDKRIANSISKLVHDLGCSCCHTSSAEMEFNTIEERHQDRIASALKNGTRVYAFGASASLEKMGVIQMGNIRLNALERLKAALQNG